MMKADPVIAALERPVILIGLPGSGKSSAGKRLASGLGVAFVDTDTALEKQLGCSIRAFFEREGEVRFRDAEQALLAELIAPVAPVAPALFTQSAPPIARGHGAHPETQGDRCESVRASVIATGGGIVLREANRHAMRAGGWVVYLHLRPEAVFHRLRNDTKRPLLQVADPLARLHELYAARDPLYRETAHQVIEVGRPKLPALVRKLAAQLRAGMTQDKTQETQA
ncbi:MAG: shikimate kinase [Burkholderiaceae bacterium]|jgi:shikimate kinase|nr:shikimate kinase [Burkholderiaceae bacterium]